MHEWQSLLHIAQMKLEEGKIELSFRRARFSSAFWRRFTSAFSIRSFTVHLQRARSHAASSQLFGSISHDSRSRLQASMNRTVGQQHVSWKHPWSHRWHHLNLVTILTIATVLQWLKYHGVTLAIVLKLLLHYCDSVAMLLFCFFSTQFQNICSYTEHPILRASILTTGKALGTSVCQTNMLLLGLREQKGYF